MQPELKLFYRGYQYHSGELLFRQEVLQLPALQFRMQT